MKNFKTLLVGLMLIVISLNAKASVLHIQYWQTKNGAKVYFVQTKQVPMLDVRILFAAGSAHDGKQLGLASLTNNMFGESTTTQNADEIAAAFDQVGATFSADVDRDIAELSLRTLSDPKYRKPALYELADVLQNISFDPRALSRNKNLTLANIKAGQQDPSTIASNAFYQAVYAGQPYSHPTTGTLQSITEITREDLIKFYRKYYVAKNAKIVIVGDATRALAQKIADRLVATLPSGSPATKLAQANLLTKPDVVHINYPTTQTTILLGQVGITRNNRFYYPLFVGNFILGGAPLNSIFFKEVRDKRGLAYYAYSTFETLIYRGPFMIALKTRVAKTQQALKVIQAQLKHFIDNGPTQAQMRLAKKNIIGGFPLKFASNSDILTVVTNIAFYDRPLNYLDTYRQRISDVTVAEVKNAFQKIIHPMRFVTVTVGPTMYVKNR